MTVLVVAAHPDDEVLGCGGSMAKWSDAGDSVHVVIMAEGATSRDKIRIRGSRKNELFQLKESAQKAGKILGVKSVKLLDFPDNRMDSLDLLDVIKKIAPLTNGDGFGLKPVSKYFYDLKLIKTKYDDINGLKTIPLIISLLF